MAVILIVDDEKMICEEFKDILEEEGHQVDTACNGHEAVNAIEDKGYDLVFLDVLMPRMEGREVFEEMRKLRPSLAIVIMSGYLPPSKENDVLKRGALACLKKPLDLERVRGLIQTASLRP